MRLINVVAVLVFKYSKQRIRIRSVDNRAVGIGWFTNIAILYCLNRQQRFNAFFYFLNFFIAKAFSEPKKYVMNKH